MPEYTVNRVINLPLSTNDIRNLNRFDVLETYTQSFTNDAGIITNHGTNVTWYLNMKELLGDTYDNYELFTIELVQFYTVDLTMKNSGPPYQTYAPLNNNVDTKYRTLNIYLTGLNFINSSFNVKSGCNSRTAYLTTLGNYYNANTNIQVTTQPMQNQYYYEEEQTGWINNNLMFRKEHYVKLNMTFGASSSDLTYTPEEAFPLGGRNNFPVFACKFIIIPFK